MTLPSLTIAQKRAWIPTLNNGSQFFLFFELPKTLKKFYHSQIIILSLIVFENDKTYGFKHSIRFCFCEQAWQTRTTERVPAWALTTLNWGLGVKIKSHYLTPKQDFPKTCWRNCSRSKVMVRRKGGLETPWLIYFIMNVS